MPKGPGSFVWYELLTLDVVAAQAFYAKVVGWSMADSGLPGMNYILAKSGDQPLAGLMAPPADVVGRAATMWFGYVLVADVDAMADRVRQAGGTIHRGPMDIPQVGRFAVAADPQGAIFMLFRGAAEPPPELAAKTPGTIGWHELHTTDPAGAFAFYEGLFGWEKSYAHDMGAMGVYQTFSAAGDWVGGMMAGVEEIGPRWLYYIAVDDIDAAASRIGEAGGQVLNGPHEVPGGSWVVVATDPQGGQFALTGARQAG